MKNLIYILFLVSIFSCETEINSLTSDESDVVVAAYIYANEPIDSIRITKSITYSSTEDLEVLDDLTITINDGSEDITLESIGNGYYRNLDYIVKESTTYTLNFEYENDVVTSQTYVQASVNVSLSRDVIQLERIEDTGTGRPGGPGGPGTTEQEVVDIFWENDLQDYFFVVIQNIEEEPDYVNEFFAEALNNEDRPQRFFRTEPEVSDIYSINSGQELQIFGTYEITVYRLNVEYAALYGTVGSSTLSIQEPPSNIDNGLGIFTAVTAHTLILEVEEE